MKKTKQKLFIILFVISGSNITFSTEENLEQKIKAYLNESKIAQQQSIIRKNQKTQQINTYIRNLEQENIVLKKQLHTQSIIEMIKNSHHDIRKEFAHATNEYQQNIRNQFAEDAYDRVIDKLVDEIRKNIDLLTLIEQESTKAINR